MNLTTNDLLDSRLPRHDRTTCFIKVTIDGESPNNARQMLLPSSNVSEHCEP